MSPEEAEAIVPNGWRMLKRGDEISTGVVLRLHKHLGTEWGRHDWGDCAGRIIESLSNYYAAPVNASRTEW